jgi:hypothetical protein
MAAALYVVKEVRPNGVGAAILLLNQGEFVNGNHPRTAADSFGCAGSIGEPQT